MPEKIIPSLFCKGFNYLGSEIRYDVNKITFKIYHETGKPVVRPLVGYYTFDKEVYSIDDEFLLGEDLLVAPVAIPDFTDGQWVMREKKDVTEF